MNSVIHSDHDVSISLISDIKYPSNNSDEKTCYQPVSTALRKLSSKMLTSTLKAVLTGLLIKAILIEKDFIKDRSFSRFSTMMIHHNVNLLHFPYIAKKNS